MKRQVWKIQLTHQVGDAIAYHKTLPIDCKILCVAEQHDHVTVWVEVPLPELPKTREYIFWVVGTGRDIPERTEYLGTAMLSGGRLVAHVYME